MIQLSKVKKMIWMTSCHQEVYNESKRIQEDSQKNCRDTENHWEQCETWDKFWDNNHW